MKRLCEVPDCGAEIWRYSKSGLCKKCRYEERREGIATMPEPEDRPDDRLYELPEEDAPISEWCKPVSGRMGERADTQPAVFALKRRMKENVVNK